MLLILAFYALLKLWENNKLMVKQTKFKNFHLTIFHIYYFVIKKLQTHFLPNNQNKDRTKLSNKTEKYVWT